MFCKYILALTLLIASTYAIEMCGRDIPCLARQAQFTFIGKVVSIQETNATDFSAEVQPLCTMYAAIEGSGILEEEYFRTVQVDHFGTHAGGSCNADTGIVGDENIFFVYANTTKVHGVARRLGLFDPCYGAFKNTPENAQILNNFIALEKAPAPSGLACPADAGKASSNPDGTPQMIDLSNDNEDDQDSGALIKYTINAMTILVALLALYLF